METNKKQLFLNLVSDYLDGKASQDEIEFLEEYYDEFSNEPDVLESMSEEEVTEIGQKVHEGVNERIANGSYHQQINGDPIHIPFYSKYRWGIAAAIAFILSITGYFFRGEEQKRFADPKTAIVQEITPGGNKAVLTLANGSKISLGDAANGNIANQQGVKVNIPKAGQLVYSGDQQAGGTNAYNTIETRNGGQYQLILPDGTKVWINAASSLRYPVNFTGNERKVELTGEAYFEVAKNKTKPFKVVTDKEEVTVLGTHFNINAYTNEVLTKTTLLEGSVKVSKLNSNLSILIKPGQQAQIKATAAKIEVQKVDPDEAIAWKNGYFMFDNETLESILRKVSRWYDVEIVNEDAGSSQKRFSGTISRYSNVSQVLKKLELTESVRFKIEGRKIIVKP